MGIGLFFQIVAAIGFMRFPDVYSRLHVVGISDTLGAPLVLLGIAVTLGPALAAAKIVLAIAFLYLTSPLVAHLLARAALEARHPAWRGEGFEPPPGLDERPREPSP